jgi:hypothetical protein
MFPSASRESSAASAWRDSDAQLGFLQTSSRKEAVREGIGRRVKDNALYLHGIWGRADYP